MNDRSPIPTEAECALRAMHVVATVNGRGVPLPIERELLLAVRRDVLPARLDVDALPLISPAELRAQLRDPDRRAWAVRCMVHVPYVSLEVDAAKIATVDAFAVQLGVAPEVLRELHAQRTDALRRIALDQARRGARIYLTVRTAAPLRAIAKALRRHCGDDALAARYRTLAGLPSGSLGRVLFERYRGCGFPLPGEPGGLDESLVPRDLLRILGGFAGDEAGDDGLQGFLAGLARLPMGRRLALDAIAERCAATHLAGTLADGGATQHLDLAAFAAAYDRGVAASAELARGWAWWGLMASDVGALRLRYGIRLARTVRVPAAAPGAAARAKAPRAA